MAPRRSFGECAEYTFKTRESWRKERQQLEEWERIKELPKNERPEGLTRPQRYFTTQVNHVIEMRGASFPISQLTQSAVTQLIFELEDEKGWTSKDTANHLISGISTIVNHCHRHRFIDKKPFDFLETFSTNEFRLTWFTMNQVEQLYETAANVFGRQFLGEIFVVLAYTGMRISELTRLRAMDVDLAGKYIHIGGRDGFVTKAKNWRVIPIQDRILPIMIERLKDASPRKKLFADDYCSTDSLRRAFNKVRNYCGISEQHVIHSLRHSYATFLNESGVPPMTIRDLMGHKRIETTLKYCKVSDEAKRQAAERLNTQTYKSVTTPEPSEAPKPTYEQLLSQVGALQQLLATLPQLAA